MSTHDQGNVWPRYALVLLQSFVALELNDGEALLLAALLTQATDDIVEFSVVDLAESLGIGRSTTYTRLKTLHERGIVERLPAAGGSQRVRLAPLRERLDRLGPVSQPRGPVSQPTSPVSPPTSPVSPPTSPVSQPTGPVSHTPRPEKAGRDPITSSHKGTSTRGSESSRQDILRAAASGRARSASSKALSRLERLRRADATSEPTPSRGQGTPERQEPKPPAAFTCNDLERAWKALWVKRWPNVSPGTWTGRDRRNAKLLLEEHGTELCIRVLEMTIGRWNYLQRQFSLNGYPSIRVVYGYRQSFFPMTAVGEQEPEKPKWGSHFDPAEERDDGAELGWGDLLE